MRIIPINCIKNDNFLLAKDIFDFDGRVLLKQGNSLNKKILNRIKLLGINYLNVVDKNSYIELENIIKPELRKKSLSLIESTFSNLLPNKKNNKKMHDFEKIMDLAEELIDDILNRNDILINLVDIKTLDNYTYEHSVNVSILSLVIGLKLRLNRDDLKQLCVGSLLHDIGKMFIPTEVLNKPSKLSQDEFKIIQSHPLKGFNYLKNIDNIPLKSRLIVLEHHEKVSGCGYPSQKKNKEINLLSKVVAIADVYDALTSNRPYRKPLSPNEALEFILGNAGSHFDFCLVKVFKDTIIPYPNGSLVKLNTGEVAIVKENFHNFPLRPTIKIITTTNTINLGREINLRKNLSLVINEAVNNIL